jgi:hypothetical protein
MARTQYRPDAQPSKRLVLEAAIALVSARIPATLAPESRRLECAVFLVASALEGQIAGIGAAEALTLAVQDASRSGLPLLTDDITRRVEEKLAADLDASLEPLLGPESWEPADGELLGVLFENSLVADRRKSLGQYYTPDVILDFLLERALAAFDPRLAQPFRVIDPACGAGNFLAPAAERLLAAYRNHREALAFVRPGERWDDAGIVSLIFRDHLAGLDIDPWAVRVTRVRLRLKALALGARRAPEPRIGHADALKRGPDASHGLLSERFQAVVGNPPYGAELSSADRAYVSARYHVGKGRFDTTALFIERGLDLLESGGRLAFVVPHGITRTGAYAPCRELLAREARYVALLDAGQAFPGVNLEAVAFVAEKRGTPAAEAAGFSAGTTRRASSAEAVELASLRSGKLEVLGTQDLSFYRDRVTVPIYVPGDVGRLIAKIESRGVKLESIARIRRGSPISARDADLRACGDGVRVVRGRDISRYVDIASADLLVLHRETPLFCAHGPAALPWPHIGYQNIASGIVATRLPADCLPLDTVNVLEPRDRSDMYLLALLGFLNSRLAAFYFRLAIANMANLTVHLDAPTIGSLPVILVDPAPIADCSARLLALRVEAGDSTGLARPEALEEAAAALDDVVAAQAGLTPGEVETVLERTEPALAALSRRRLRLRG